MPTPEELRREAAEIRLAAQHADRRSVARREFARAYELESQAAAMEGKHMPPAPRVEPKSFAEREQARRERVNRFLEGKH